MATLQENRTVLFDAVNALRLSSATEDHCLIDAWSSLSEPTTRRADWIPVQSVPLRFASKRWRALLRHPTDPAQIDRRQLEICVLSYIGDYLQAGNLFVPGSEAFADHRAELLSWPECELRLKEYCDRLNLPAAAEPFVRELQWQLTEAATESMSIPPEHGRNDGY